MFSRIGAKPPRGPETIPVTGPVDVAAFNVPNPPAPAAVPVFGTARPSPISNALAWLVRAFNLSSQGVPTALSLDPVRAVVDVLQGGWGLAQWRYAQDTLQNFAPAVIKSDIVTPSLDTQAVTGFYAYQSTVIAGDVPVEASLLLYTGVPSLPKTAAPYNSVVLANFWIPVADVNGSGISWGAIMGRADAIVTVPPGWGLGLTIDWPAAPPALSVAWSAQIATLPGQQRGGR